MRSLKIAGDIIGAVCAAAELECTIVPVAWDGIIPSFGAVNVSFQVTVDPFTPDNTVITNQADHDYDSGGTNTNDASQPTDDPVTPAQFESHLQALRNAGYQAVPLADLLSYLATGQPQLPANAVVLTFDDGYEDNYTHAFPLLQGRDKGKGGRSTLRPYRGGRAWELFKSFARPSQNCAKLFTTLKTVGEFSAPCFPPTPAETAVESAPPLERL